MDCCCLPVFVRKLSLSYFNVEMFSSTLRSRQQAELYKGVRQRRQHGFAPCRAEWQHWSKMFMYNIVIIIIKIWWKITRLSSLLKGFFWLSYDTAWVLGSTCKSNYSFGEKLANFDDLGKLKEWMKMNENKIYRARSKADQCRLNLARLARFKPMSGPGSQSAGVRGPSTGQSYNFLCFFLTVSL